MAELSTDRENRIEIEHILAARDILRQMLDELLNLGGKNGRLHLRICTSGHAIQQRLHMLAGLTEILKVAPREDDLIRRAK